MNDDIFVRSEHKPTNPVKVIRLFCKECMCGSSAEIANCTAPKCPLYDWRMGTNPYRKKRILSDDEKERLRVRLHGK